MDRSVTLKRIAKMENFPYFTKNSTELKYFLDYSGSNGYLLILSKNQYLFYTDPRYIESCRTKMGNENVRLLENMYLNPIIGIARDFTELQLKNIYIDFSLWTHAEFLGLVNATEKEGISFNKIPTPTERIRKIKDVDEINSISKAQEIAEKSLMATIGLLKEGVMERDIANEFDYLIRKNGAQGNSFSSIVVFGKNTSLPHGVPSENKLKKGDVVLFDIGALYNNYCSDMTRMFSFGEPANVNFKKHYEILLSLQKESILQVKEGKLFADLDLFVREGLKKESLEQYFTHSLGHGVGIDIHEIPRIYFEKREEKIEKGCVFTIEPGLYLEGEYGMRIEDLLYIDEKGQTRFISSFPKDLLIL